MTDKKQLPPSPPALSPEYIAALKEWGEVQREIYGDFEDSGLPEDPDDDPCFARDLDLED